MTATDIWDCSSLETTLWVAQHQTGVSVVCFLHVRQVVPRVRNYSSARGSLLPQAQGRERTSAHPVKNHRHWMPMTELK
jgi:hypothetical protein